MSNAGSYEAMLQRLEEIVRRLEDGKLSLDEAINLYSEGISVSEKCGELLRTAQLKISLCGSQSGSEVRDGEDLQ